MSSDSIVTVILVAVLSSLRSVATLHVHCSGTLPLRRASNARVSFRKLAESLKA